MALPVTSNRSTAMVVYNSIPYEIPERGVQFEKLVELIMRSSLSTQLADQRCLHSMTVRDRILNGAYCQLETGPGLPEPFNGTREDLLDMITNTVHATFDRLDYNGCFPYLKITDQLEKGANFEEVRVDSRNEEFGSTCVGMSHAILKELKDQHNVEGVLAFQRQSSSHPLEHGAAIIECSDGFILLEPRSNPDQRIFSIPFGTSLKYVNSSITASHPGSTTPLVLSRPNISYEYCTNVGNGDDLIMKYYVMHAPFKPDRPFFPIATYNKDGSDRKFIGVSLKESLLFLKDRKAPQGTSAEIFSFEWIRHNPQGFHEKLSAFMEPNECFTGFHLPTELVYEQLTRLISQEPRIRKLFMEAHPKSIF